MPYVSIFNPDVTDADTTKTRCWTRQDRRIQLNGAAELLNSVLQQAAAAEGFSFANDNDLQGKFNGHRFCENASTAGGGPDGLSIWDPVWWPLTPAQQAAFMSSYNNDTPSPFATPPVDQSNPHRTRRVASWVYRPTIAGRTAYYQTLQDTIRRFPITIRG